MTKVKRVNTSNDAGALAMSPNVRAMRCDARRDAIDARGQDGTGRDGTTRGRIDASRRERARLTENDRRNAS